MKKILYITILFAGSLAFTSCQSGLCSDTCQYAKDGVCDDGGSNATYSTCTYGTDCTDCGAR